MKDATDVQEVTKEVESKAKRPKHSSYFITLNTNKSFINPTEEYHQLKQQLREFIEKEFGTEKLYEYITIKEPNDSINDIEEIDVDSVLEVGDNNHFLHAHLVLHFKHRTRMQLSYSKIRNAFGAEVDGGHAWIQYFRAAGKTIEEYINKHISRTKTGSKMLDEL